jgi:hypothetical protein
MKKFLESKGIKVNNIEGDDISSVFHVSNDDRKKVQDNLQEYQKESSVAIVTSDSFGMSVVVMENEDTEE